MNRVALDQPPPAAAAFVDAYAHGDFAAADEVASPLYGAEWARRGVSSQNLDALLPASYDSSYAASRWLEFAFRGSAIDANGFNHLLYTARPPDDPTGATTIWRVDTDPRGRVIWIEMVYLFSSKTNDVTVVVPRGASSDREPERSVSQRTYLLLEVRSAACSERYDLVGIRPESASRNDVERPTKVGFFAVDHEENFRPGAWSYGIREPSLPEYGKIPAWPVPLRPDLVPINRLYLDSLL